MVEIRYVYKDGNLEFDEVVAKNADVHVEVLADYDPDEGDESQACVMVAIDTGKDRKLLFIYSDGPMHFNVEEG